MIVTQHNSAWVALLATYADRDRITDCDVAAISVSLELVEYLRGRLALAKRLKADHNLAQIAWWDDRPTFYAGNYEEAELDDSLPLPRWTEDAARVDALQLCADDDSVWWESTHHYADVPVSTERLTAADLDTLAESLREERTQ